MDTKKPHKPGLPQHSSKSNEWYTPPDLIQLARACMGSIDLDPCSNEKAQAWIRATKFYTLWQNGLAQPWTGSTWLNPPYGRVAKHWVARVLDEYHARTVTQALVLLSCSPERKWFRPLWAFPMCFPYSRIGFLDHNLKPRKDNPGASVIVFLPKRVFGAVSWWIDEKSLMRFDALFSRIGHVIFPRERDNVL